MQERRGERGGAAGAGAGAGAAAAAVCLFPMFSLSRTYVSCPLVFCPGGGCEKSRLPSTVPHKGR